LSAEGPAVGPAPAGSGSSSEPSGKRS